MIDTHTHLYLPEFDQDIDGVIERAVAHGVQEFYLPAIDSSTTQAMYALEKRYPERMHLMMGLHPTSVQENFQQELDHVYQELSKCSFYLMKNIKFCITILETHCIQFLNTNSMLSSYNST